MKSRKMFNKTLVRYFNTASNSKSFGHKSTKSTFYVRFVFHIAVLFYVHSAVRKIGARAERSDSEQSLNVSLSIFHFISSEVH